MAASLLMNASHANPPKPMFDHDRWQEIFQTISKNKLRTALSGFTVALGIFIFIILFGLGNGLKNTFQQFFMDDATNLLRLYPNRTSRPYKGFKSNRAIHFTTEDLDAIEMAFPHFIDYVTLRIYRNGTTSYKDQSNSYTFMGVSPDHMKAENTVIMKGRYIDLNDVLNKEKHVVIGRLVEQDLFQGDDALGKEITIRGSVFTVIGVFQDTGGDNEERIMLAPYSTIQMLMSRNDYINQIIVAFKPTMGFVQVMAFEKALKKMMKERHTIHPNDPRGIYIQNVASNLQENQQFATVLQIIVSFVGFGTLIAGIIGISNIMVFVIRERTKELGIRKALGATPKSIIGMVMQESIFITTISGGIGLVFGTFVLNSIGTTLKQYFIRDPYMDMGVGIGATLLLILFGAMAGYIPARRAAKIKPIEALRDE